MEHIAALLTVTQKALLAGDNAIVRDRGGDLLKWPEDTIRETLARKLDLAWMDVQPDHIDLAAFQESATACREESFLPSFRSSISLHVFMVNPFHGPAIRLLRNRFHREVHPIGTSRRAMERTLSWLEARAPAKPAPVRSASSEICELLSWSYVPEEGQGFIKRLLNEAYVRQVSDVYVESYPDRIDIRFKVGGGCVVMPPIDCRYASRLFSDLKAFASMSTRETRGYRDGSAELQMSDGNVLNFRVVAQKSLSGETITIRLLDKTVVTAQTGELPFPARFRPTMAAMINKGEGLIVACGPTGSGKTTLLWRLLRSLDSSSKKIVTIEDPVEYRFDRFVQMPVKGREEGNTDQIPETFATALRSCLRASPDVILVGEMRDRETARTGIEAGLTGHLIFSTLHTPDAIGVVPRFFDLGVSALNLRQTLLGVIAQRLGPRLCSNCRIEVPTTPEQAAHYQFYHMPSPNRLCRQGACPQCRDTGVAGRVPVMELLVITPRLRAMIQPEFNEDRLRELWINEEGGQSLAMHALELAAEGAVTYDFALSLDGIYVPPPASVVAGQGSAQ